MEQRGRRCELDYDLAFLLRDEAAWGGRKSGRPLERCGGPGVDPRRHGEIAAAPPGNDLVPGAPGELGQDSPGLGGGVADCRSREREERQRLRVAGGPARGSC